MFYFLEKITNSSTSTRILCLLKENENVVQGVHLYAAIKTLNGINRRDKTENHKIKNEINKIIQDNIGKISIGECSRILNIISSKYCSNNNKFVESSVELLLNKIMLHLDELHLCSYAKLSIYLTKIQPSSVSQSLLEALKFKFDIKMLKIYEENLEFLADAYSFAARNIKDEKVLSKLLVPLKRNTDKIPLDCAFGMLECSSYDEYPEALEMFNLAKEVIAKKIDELNSNQILYIMIQLRDKIDIS